jgi:ABC-type Zn uptake system ZnuABC Zn-binding protein ZnuA
MESPKQLIKKVSSGDLTTLTDEQLHDRLEELLDADPNEEESGDDFINCQKEIKVIEAELEHRRQYGTSR